MKIQDNSIIIAPANLHLAIYQQILKTNNNCINLQVISLSAFINKFTFPEQKTDLYTLYTYRLRLHSLSTNNSYKNSVNDIQFLSSCLSFIQWMKLYNVKKEDLPEETHKEKDIKEVISLLYDVSIFEDNANKIIYALPSLDHVYIVDKELNKIENFWIENLLKNGAHLLQEHYVSDTYYYSVANNKSQAKLVAQKIIQDQLNADDIFIACNSECEKQILSQIFSLHKIPYTILTQNSLSLIPKYWITCLNWIQNKNLKTYLSLIETMYKEDYEMIYQYYSLFPEQFDNPHSYLNKLSYKNNNLISEIEFNTIKTLEYKAHKWNKEHAYLFDWDYKDFEKISQEIQFVHSHIQIDDLNILKKINQYCIDAYPFLLSSDDLSLLIQKISSDSFIENATEIKGILIGDKTEITSIRPVLFLLGAHTKNYPSLTIESGLFDEFYLRKVNLPSLQNRLDIQRSQVKRTLLSHTKTYIIYPQSDYEGNSYSSSIELENWIHKKSVFVSLPDISINIKPEFNVNSQTLNTLLFKQKNISVSRLETFSKCPLQHFLKYGLNLKESVEINDISTRGSVLHSILEKMTKLYKKNYVHLQYDQIYDFINQEFDFYSQVYPAKKNWIQTQIMDYTNTIQLIIEQLNYFEKNWYMTFSQSEHKFKKTIRWNDLEIELIGYVDRIDTSNTSFCIFDYKSSLKTLDKKKFQSGLSLQLPTYTLAYNEETNLKPVGCFYISLKTSYIDCKALHIKYSKKEENVKINPLNNDEEFITQPIISGWGFDGLDIYQNDTAQIKQASKSLSIPNIKEQWEIIIHTILNKMVNEDVFPNHVQNACSFCGFGRICRNARKEINLESYIEETE